MAKKKKVQAELLPPSPQDITVPYPFIYDACCSGCGTRLGTVGFPEARPDWDPQNAGLKCGRCVDKEDVLEDTSIVEGVL